MDNAKSENRSGVPGDEPLKIRITIENHDMTASCKVLGSTKQPLTEYMLKEAIEKEGIKFGIDQAAIQRLLTEFQGDSKRFVNLSVTIAKGKPVAPSKDGYVKILVSPVEKVRILEDGTVNFRDIRIFREVRKGDVLAEKMPPFAGENGINVYNKAVFPLRPSEGGIHFGKNITYNENTKEYVALTDGVFEERANWMDINSLLTIDSNVGLETGNIDYLGEIHINGNIERGASARAKGNIKVEGVIESGKVDSGGSIIAKIGINTKKDSRLVAKLDIISNYIEHSNVLAYRDLIIGKSIVNSQVAAMQNLTLLSKDSAIIGSYVTVYGNIEASTIGSKAGSKTIIVIGKHLIHEEEYKEVKDEFLELKKTFRGKLERVKELKEYVEKMKGRLNNAQIEKIKRQLIEYKDIIVQKEKFRQRQEDLRSASFNPKPVKLIVKNVIYPGVEINYKNNIFRIESNNRNVVYTFHPDLQKYSIQPYV